MNIKIISDSTCDLSNELIKQNNITLMPLTVVKDGAQFRDGVDITPAEIFAHVAAGGDLCSTAAINVGEYRIVPTVTAQGVKYNNYNIPVFFHLKFLRFYLTLNFIITHF